jgi:predicted ATPase
LVGEGSLGGVVIRTPDQRLRVFVSSTMGELAEERRAVSRAVSALRLTPVLFELGAQPHPPQEVYRAYLAQSDVFVGLYWQRYGWIGPGMTVSGLEDEFDLSAGMPRLLYIKAPAPDREPRLADLLARIREEAQASYHAFRTATELGRMVREDLATLLSEQFAAARSPAPAAARPAPATPRGPRPLPMSTTSLIGREQDIGELTGLVEQPGSRLVTLTGPGGIGKTRLAVAVGERLQNRFSDMVFVPLAAVTDPELVLAGVARAVGADLGGAGSPLQALAEWLGGDQWLLILDNLEQVVSAAGDLGELLARCPGVVILATSRTVLGLAAEREYPVPPLPLPDSAPASPAAPTLTELESSPAVALFVDRARAVRPGFALAEGNATAVTEICRRLEGLPLAIELAAARIRLLDPAALLDRLAASLDALGTGAVDLPERQRTLRATVEWSVGLLDDGERSLLETMAVFTGGWTIGAAAQVAGLDDDRALELLEALARHSLIQLDSTGPGPRCGMLETVRAFVAERLAGCPDAAEIERRHADYYRALTEQSDRPLRGAGQTEWIERLEADAGNLAAAVRWHLAHDPAPLPHLFRILWPFWYLRDRQAEARPWVNQLLPVAASLDPHPRAELELAATATANEVGDDAAAMAGHWRLEPLLEEIQDPFLHGVCQLVMAWTSPITGDFEGALREVLASLAELRDLDEPFFTAMAAFTAGAAETNLGHPEGALRHLVVMRELADRFGFTWLTASAQLQLGTLAIVEGRLDQARDLLDEALDLSLAIRSIRNVTLCLDAFAQMTFAEGDPERAALLAGAAEGLRRRTGFTTWPTMRREGAGLAAQIREALGDDRYDQAFAAGTRLSQQEAVAAIRDQPDHLVSRPSADLA